MSIKKTEDVWLGFTVKAEPGPVLKPTQIHFWKDDQFKSHKPEAPLKYHSDALLGLSLVHLNPHLKNPFTAPKMNFPFCYQAWLALEPHFELYQRSQPRVKSLRQHVTKPEAGPVEYFERNCTDILESSIYPWGIDLKHLQHLIEAIEYLESKTEVPLLYNFGLQLPKPLIEKLHHLHSLLFNLRSLVAVDHNAYIHDPTHEALKVDSITDYIPRADYVANDAILYWNFRKSKEELPTPVAEKLEKSFRTYSHNGYCLIHSLPKSFLNSLRTEELEEVLYLTQMDWLLGTEAGLLFRLREELYGLREGYSQIFWPEASGTHPQTQLEVSCYLTPSDIEPRDVAA